MFRRPSIRSTVTTLAAAAVLVGGADLASYAATGHPLVLGQSNSAVGTTSLKNIGRGPALSLNSAKSSPPLVVNSKKLVKHLNADTVHGVPASVVAPTSYQVRASSIGNTWTDDRFVTTTVQPGTYQITLTGVPVPTTSSTQSLTCLVGDKRFFTGPPPTDFHQLWAIYFNEAVTASGAVVNAVGTATIGKHVTVVVGCIGGGATWTTFGNLQANLTRVNGVTTRRATTYVPPLPRTRILPGR